MSIEAITQQYLNILHINANKDVRGVGGVGRSPALMYHFTIEPGSKYLKVVQTLGVDSRRSVHCFIEKLSGNVYKAASWKAPVLDPRYNLYRDIKLLEHIADPYGGYLYKGFVTSLSKINLPPEVQELLNV